MLQIQQQKIDWYRVVVNISKQEAIFLNQINFGTIFTIFSFISLSHFEIVLF